MSGDNAQSYVHLFEECQTRIQTLGELLLIPCKPHPVFTHKEDLAATNDNFVRFRDEVISHLNRMLILSRDVSSHLHADSFQWRAFQQPLSDLTATIVQLTQLSAHIAYLLALNVSGSKPAIVGPVASRHRLVQADLELRFICSRLKHSRAADLNPHILVEMCSTVTKCLSSMTEICREAAEKIPDSSEQDQFKLCIKAITSTTGCLVSSVKSFKHAANESHLQRVVSFCQPVVSTSAALLAFATEEQFLGCPAELNYEAKEMFKSVIGLAMSMVSACVQITKAARDLVHDPTRVKHKDRVSLCVGSISRAASRLRDLLLSYEFVVNLEAASPSHVKGEQDFASNSSGQFSFNIDNNESLSCHGRNESVRDLNNTSPSSSSAEDNASPSLSPSAKPKSSSSKSSHSHSHSHSPKSKRHSQSHHRHSPSSSSHHEHTSALNLSGQASGQTIEPNSPTPLSMSSSSSPTSMMVKTQQQQQHISESSDSGASVKNGGPVNTVTVPDIEVGHDKSIGPDFQEKL